MYVTDESRYFSAAKVGSLVYSPIAMFDEFVNVTYYNGAYTYNGWSWRPFSLEGCMAEVLSYPAEHVSHTYFIYNEGTSADDGRCAPVAAGVNCTLGYPTTTAASRPSTGTMCPRASAVSSPPELTATAIERSSNS